MDASVDVIMQLDKEMKIIWANKRAAEMINDIPENLMGRKCHDIYYDSDDPCKECFCLNVAISILKYYQGNRLTNSAEIFVE